MCVDVREWRPAVGAGDCGLPAPGHALSLEAVQVLPRVEDIWATFQNAFGQVSDGCVVQRFNPSPAGLPFCLSHSRATMSSASPRTGTFTYPHRVP